MYSASLLSLQVKVTNWKVSGGTNSRVVNMTHDTVHDKFTDCEVVFTAGKNAASDSNFRFLSQILGKFYLRP